MKLLALAALAIVLPAYADFSYKVTRKTGGMMGGMAGGPTTSTYYYKGQKMKVDNGATATIIDFDARTITNINNTAKTVSVKRFDDIAPAAGNVNATVQVKETGQKKTVNGYEASEAVLTVEVEAPPGRQMGKMQMDMDMWLSSEVPGADQLFAFHQRNAANFPWSALTAGGNPSMASAMADAQRRLAAMHGVPVQEIVRVKSPGGAGAPAMPQMTGAQADKMAQARAQLEAMAAQGGPAAAAAQQALARMGSMPGAAGGGAPSSGALMEITMDSSDFSGGSIPDSVFAIPGDYQKTN
jgi:hypothetical protein